MNENKTHSTALPHNLNYDVEFEIPEIASNIVSFDEKDSSFVVERFMTRYFVHNTKQADVPSP